MLLCVIFAPGWGDVIYYTEFRLPATNLTDAEIGGALVRMVKDAPASLDVHMHNITIMRGP